ncbi:BT4734/BF3469 family protein [uncultured Bacteroides sp.]|uniref:BT4734/BF3469 family protein n=1 Tax=uncultured Bacteroides sp. TaxID=162156 RepID=UPI0025D1A152|nr:BT4734/BF3469 family protein [uncultured Bacteroides sp.]
MTNDFRMSYFMPPIAPVKDERGRIVTPATLTPFCEVSVEQVYEMITCNEKLRILTEQVRNSGDIREAKASLLPYVTPCGTFTRRSSKNFVAVSGLVVVDIDHLDSYQEAVEMRSKLFNDKLLRPILTFISPSGRGVKAFVPCNHLHMNEANSVTENIKWALAYVVLIYGTGAPAPFGEKQKGVDFSGKDIVRSCFLSHDPGALFRATKE